MLTRDYRKHNESDDCNYSGSLGHGYVFNQNHTDEMNNNSNMNLNTDHDKGRCNDFDNVDGIILSRGRGGEGGGTQETTQIVSYRVAERGSLRKPSSHQQP
jgi:hypothetical protein